MYHDVGFFMEVKKADWREKRSRRPGVSVRESEQRVDGQSSIDAADLERLEKFMIRAALGAMSAVMKMLNLIAFPLLLCIEGRLQYYGLFLATYEMLYIINACFLVPYVERYWKSRGAEVLRFFAVGLDVVAWLLYLIILGSEGNFELLWVLQILFGISSLLQLQVLSREASENFECADIDCGGVSTSDGIDRELLVSDIGLLHYLTVLGPVVAILASISVRLEEGEIGRTVRGLVPVGVLGTIIAFGCLLLSLYISFGFPPPSRNSREDDDDDNRDYAVVESERGEEPTVTVPRETMDRVSDGDDDGGSWEKYLLHSALFLFFSVFEGSLWTIFAFNYLSSSRLINIYSPFLIGAVMAYGVQLDCWCWNDGRFSSFVSRYRFFTPGNRGYMVSGLGSTILLVGATLQLLTVVNHSSVDQVRTTADEKSLLRPTVFAYAFLLGLSGALFYPSLERALLNMNTADACADSNTPCSTGSRGTLVVISPDQESGGSQRFEHRHRHGQGHGHGVRLMSVFKRNLGSMGILAAAGRLAGVLFGGSIVGITCSRYAPTCALSGPTQDPAFLYLLTGTNMVAGFAVVVLLAVVICGKWPLPHPPMGITVVGGRREVSAAHMLYHDSSGAGVLRIHERLAPHFPRVSLPGHTMISPG